MFSSNSGRFIWPPNRCFKFVSSCILTVLCVIIQRICHHVLAWSRMVASDPIYHYIVLAIHLDSILSQNSKFYICLKMFPLRGFISCVPPARYDIAIKSTIIFAQDDFQNVARTTCEQGCRYVGCVLNL